MNRYLLSLCTALLGCVLVVGDADAGRLGGGRSVGVQRSVTPSKPAQQQAAPQQQPGTPQQSAAAGGNRWMPILGGLALGGMLGYLFGGNGVLGIVLLAVLAVGIGLAVRALIRGAPRRVEYAGTGRQTIMAPPSVGAAGAQESPRGQVPAGFDAESFLKAAKLNFIRLQAAHDGARLEEIRELMTDELFEELRRDIRGADQHTDVASLRADLVELATEGDRHWASVHFSGTVREAPGAAPAGFEEVWNLVKPKDGSSGWLLAGIQQMH